MLFHLIFTLILLITIFISTIIFLKVYIRNCGSHRIEIGHQMFVMKRLESVAEAVVLGDSKDERKRILKERLREIVLPTTFKLPLSPHLNVRKSKYFLNISQELVPT